MTFAAAFEDNFCKCWIHFFFISFFTSDIFRPHFFFWILIRIVDTTTHREMQGSGKTVLSVKKFYCTLHRSISTYLLSRCHFGILSPACSLISSLLTQIITHNTTSKDFIDNIDVFLWVHKANNVLVSKTPTNFNIYDIFTPPLDFLKFLSTTVCIFLLILLDKNPISFSGHDWFIQGALVGVDCHYLKNRQWSVKFWEFILILIWIWYDLFW